MLDGLCFEARRGEVTAFLGPNGAGKTTTMRVLATLLRPDQGLVLVNGVDVAARPDEVRRQIGLVTEEPSLLDRFSIREQLEFSCGAHGLSAAKTADRVAFVTDALGLDSIVDERAGALSKGNRQKASLARAIVHDPPVLLLDEPTANLDLVAQDALQRLLLDPSVRHDRTVLLSTHVVDEAERLSDRVVALNGGRAVVSGTPAEIAAAEGHAGFRDALLSVFDSDQLVREAGR